MAVEKIILDIQARLADAQKKIKSLEGGVSKVNKEVQKSEKLFAKAGTTIAAIFSVAAIGAFVKQIIEVRAEFEKYSAVLKNTLGSAEKANIEFAKIQKFAAQTPFSVRELTDAFVKLVNQGFKPTTEQMRKLGDVAASTGKTFDMLTEAIIDATVGEFERLKEFGIRAKKAGDTVKFTFKEVETQVDFTAKSIREYILSLGDLIGVSGAMDEISKTLGGRISNLGDSWDVLLDTLGSRTSGIFTFVITKLNEFITATENAAKTTEELISAAQSETQRESIERDIETFKKWMEANQGRYESAYEGAEDYTKFLQGSVDEAERMLKGSQAAAREMGIFTEKEILNMTIDANRSYYKTIIAAIKSYAAEIDKDADKTELNRLQKEQKAAQKVIKEYKKQLDAEMSEFDKMVANKIAGQEYLRDMELKIEQDKINRKKELGKKGESYAEKQAKAELQIELIKQQGVISLINTGFRMAQSARAEDAVAQKLLAIASSIISTYLTAQLQAQSMAFAGPFAAEGARAEAITAGWINTALIAAVAILGSYWEGGFTGKSKLPPQVRDRHGRIAGVVHENEFVFNEEKTKVLRPFFTDIQNDRIDIRGLAALTQRGVIMPVMNNQFNSDVLEREVGNIYRKISEEKPGKPTIISTGYGYKKIIGNTIINVKA